MKIHHHPACIAMLAFACFSLASDRALAEVSQEPLQAKLVGKVSKKRLSSVMFEVGETQLSGLVSLPAHYQTSTEKWPLLIFLHGAGQKGTDTEKLKRNGPILRVIEGKKFPFVILAPQCPEDGYWSREKQVTQLNAILDATLKEYRIDESRIYLTGLSMGAHGVWNWAATNPERFAALAPIAGGAGIEGGSEQTAAIRLAKMPIWVFHGDADENVPFKQSEVIVDALRKAGAGDHLKFTIYPGAGHNTWTETYNNDELYTWLLAQRK